MLYPLAWNYPGIGVLRNLSVPKLAARFTRSAAVTLWTGVWRAS